MRLGDEQKQLVHDLLDIIINNNFEGKFFTLTVGGYAGTGKTTVISELRNKLNQYQNFSVAFVTFTGKAAYVLKNKLQVNNALYSNDYCGTIHSFVYQPETRWDSKLQQQVIIGWRKKHPNAIRDKTNLILIDEASMISEKMWIDLKSYEIPIIAFGDHKQLPPVSNGTFNLMENPDFKLTKIYRFLSPITKLSQFVRNYGYIPLGFYSPEVFKLSWNNPKCQHIWNNIDYSNNDLQVLCGFNTTRVKLNNVIRTKLNYTQKAPYPNEKIICLANNYFTNIMNGQIGKVIWLIPIDEGYRITLDIDGDIYECDVSNRCFGEVNYKLYNSNKKKKEYNFENKNLSFFDYGYTISVHKSQGSEWDKVILFEQRSKNWDDEYYARWLYTAITRSRLKLFVITDFWF